MIFIIEGPDGSGKSTLAETLAKQTGYPVVHMSNPKTEEEKANMLNEYLGIIESGRNVIFDRCWYSEMVYGPIMRGASVINYPSMYMLESKLAKRGAMIIYCTDKPKTLWRRATKRGEEYITDYNKFESICAGFDVLMSVPHIVPVVKYGYEDL